jgi:hypothetical protein
MNKLQEVKERMSPEDKRKCEELERGLTFIEAEINVIEKEFKESNLAEDRKSKPNNKLEEAKKKQRVMIDALKDMIEREEKIRLSERKNKEDRSGEPGWVRRFKSDLKGKYEALAARLERQR